MNKNFNLFKTFFKIGLFTFGGGYAMIPLIEKEAVEKQNWITEEDLLEIIAIAESTPGPIAINCATFIGKKQGGFLGALLATIGVCIPSVVIIILISFFIEEFLANKIIANAFYGIRACVAILILNAFLKLFIKGKKTAFSLILFGATCVISLFLPKFSPIYLILIGAAISILFYTIKNNVRRKEHDLT